MSLSGDDAKAAAAAAAGREHRRASTLLNPTASSCIKNMPIMADMERRASRLKTIGCTDEQTFAANAALGRYEKRRRSSVMGLVGHNYGSATGPLSALQALKSLGSGGSGWSAESSRRESVAQSRRESVAQSVDPSAPPTPPSACSDGSDEEERVDSRTSIASRTSTMRKSTVCSRAQRDMVQASLRASYSALGGPGGGAGRRMSVMGHEASDLTRMQNFAVGDQKASDSRRGSLFKSQRTQDLLIAKCSSDTCIKDSALFRNCDELFVERLLECVSTEMFEEGKNMMCKGDRGSSLYLLVRGNAEVIVDGERAAVLTEGDCFGEGNALPVESNSKRTATIRAITFCDCRVIERDAIQHLLKTFSNCRTVIEFNRKCMKTATTEQKRMSITGMPVQRHARRRSSVIGFEVSHSDHRRASLFDSRDDSHEAKESGRLLRRMSALGVGDLGSLPEGANMLMASVAENDDDEDADASSDDDSDSDSDSDSENKKYSDTEQSDNSMKAKEMESASAGKDIERTLSRFNSNLADMVIEEGEEEDMSPKNSPKASPKSSPKNAGATAERSNAISILAKAVADQSPDVDASVIPAQEERDAAPKSDVNEGNVHVLQAVEATEVVNDSPDGVQKSDLLESTRDSSTLEVQAPTSLSADASEPPKRSSMESELNEDISEHFLSGATRVDADDHCGSNLADAVEAVTRASVALAPSSSQVTFWNPWRKGPASRDASCKRLEETYATWPPPERVALLWPHSSVAERSRHPRRRQQPVHATAVGAGRQAVAMLGTARKRPLQKAVWPRGLLPQPASELPAKREGSFSLDAICQAVQGLGRGKAVPEVCLQV